MRFLIVVIVLLGGLLPALAQDDLSQRLEMSRTLCDLSAEAFVEEYTDAYWPAIERSAQVDARKLDAASIVALKKVLSDEIRREHDVSLDAFVQAYAQAFTVDELKQLLVFYRSPVGAKLIATAPAVARQTLPAVQSMLAANIPAVISRIEAEARRLGVEPSA